MPQALPMVYLDGELLPLEQARVPVLDRGFLYGDGVYEVVGCYAGEPFLLDRHLDRLARSLAQIHCPAPARRTALEALVRDLVAANPAPPPDHFGRLAVYLQITRGDSGGRAHQFPAEPRPRLFAMCLTNPPPAAEALENGLAVILRDDFRWSRCDIKSTSLLGNVLAREEAAAQGAAEALLHRDGLVSEGSTTNVIALIDGELVSPPDGPSLLPGVTRDWVLEQAAADGLPCARRQLGVDELRRAREVWLTSTTREVLPVTRIDGMPVGAGRPGPHWRAAYARFQRALPTAADGTHQPHGEPT